MEIAELTTLADYFVLATGASNTQINALVDNVEKVLAEEAGEQPLHREGYRGGTWVLLDYGCFAIHVFNQRGPGLLRPGASVAGRQERGPERRHRRARMKCFRRFSRKTGLTFGKNALK